MYRATCPSPLAAPAGGDCHPRSPQMGERRHREGSDLPEATRPCRQQGWAGRQVAGQPLPLRSREQGPGGLPDASEGTGRAPCCPRLPSALRGQKSALSQGADQRAWVLRLELPRERNLPPLKSSPLSSILLKSILNGPPDAVGPGA